VYSGEEVLIDSAVTTGDRVTEEDTEAGTETSGLILPSPLADANGDSEEEGLTEPSSDTVAQTERVAVENASDGLALTLSDGEPLADSTRLYDTNGVRDASIVADPSPLTLAKGPLALPKGLAVPAEEPLALPKGLADSIEEPLALTKGLPESTEEPLALTKGLAVPAEEPLALAKGLAESAEEPLASAEEEREGPTEREAVTAPEAVLEFVCDRLGLEDTLPTPELVIETLPDPQAEADLLATTLFVTDTLTNELRVPIKLAVATADSEETSDAETLPLAECDELASPDSDANEDGLSLVDAEELAKPEAVPESLNVILIPALGLPEVVREATSLALYVPDTVSVTPVGKVVILGVEVVSCDTVPSTLPLTLPDLDLPGDRLTTPLFDTNPERLTVREP
jgi:hypothetical protein